MIHYNFLSNIKSSWSWGQSSVAEHLPSTQESLASIPSQTNQVSHSSNSKRWLLHLRGWGESSVAKVLCKPENLSLSPVPHVQSWAQQPAVHTCNPSPAEGKIGGSLSSLASQCVLTAELQANKTPCLKGGGLWSWGCYLSSCSKYTVCMSPPHTLNIIFYLSLSLSTYIHTYTEKQIGCFCFYIKE